jgi:guanine deaminase
MKPSLANTECTQYLAMAINLASANVRNSGGPFGAVVVSADGRIFEGTNRVTATNDPTAHAEVTAIRTAAAALGTFDLSGAVLYTSCEPCPMCLASSLWARISRVVYAADRHDAARSGFDDAVFYNYFDAAGDRQLMPVVRDGHQDTDYLQPFQLWDRLDTRIDY